MIKSLAIVVLVIASPAVAGGTPGYYGGDATQPYGRSAYSAPPVTIYARPYEPPPAYASSPPVVIGQAIGGIVEGAISIQFNLLGGFFGALTKPGPSVPDGAGGIVSFYNPRILPDGSLRPYDPALDGYPPVYATEPAEPLYQPPATYEPQTPSRPLSGHRRGAASQPCYSSDGRWMGDGNPDCRG